MDIQQFLRPQLLQGQIIIGETPRAFVKLKVGFDVDAQELTKFCRDHLPHYMAPKTVIFEELPRTSTGKDTEVYIERKNKGTWQPLLSKMIMC